MICLSYSRDANSAGIRPAATAPVKAPVPGGVPTPFAAAPLPSASSPKPYLNSAAPAMGSPIPTSKPPNRAPSPIVFPPPLPSHEFNFQQTTKPHVQFRPVESNAFNEHDEELSSIMNQVKMNYFNTINRHMREKYSLTPRNKNSSISQL
jgi:hypothetical protein